MKEATVKFNDEQKSIIEEGLGQNLLVSAAAGSGKTTVLTERITRKILGENCDGKEISLSNILVMTFTKKATAEMKSRIKQKLEDRLNEGKNVKKLIRESSIIQNANISTIDAFCKKVLQENYTALTRENSLYFDFDLTYRIADDKEIAVLWDDVIDDFFEMQYMNEKYKVLYDSYVDKTDESRLRALLIKGLKFLTSVTWPDEYLHNQILNFEANAKKAYKDYVKLLTDKLVLLKDKINTKLIDINAMRQMYSDSFSSGVNAKGNKLTDKGKEDLNDAISYIDGVISFLNEYCELKFIVDGKDGKSIDKESFEKLYKECQSLVSTKPKYPMVTYISGISKDEFDDFKASFQRFLEELKLVSKVYTVLNFTDERICNNSEKIFLEFLREFYLKIVSEKRKRNLYEISDYSRMSLDILYDKNVEKDGHIYRTISKRAHDIAAKYELIFIDEYQDTNYIQEKILAAISDNFAKGNVFMVGDVKQSIYGFRNAEPSIFMNKYEEFSEGKGGKNKTLSTNYRSSKEIIGYVNDLFSKAMTPKFGVIDYNVDNALGFKDEEKNRDIIDDKKVEIHVVYKEEGADSTFSPLDYEADFVAAEIKKLVDEKKCKFSDIVILLRTIKYKAKTFEEALKRHKVPSYAEQRTGFFEKLEIKLMTDILSIIDNPLQNISLAAVLKSNIFNLSHDELAFIKLVSNSEYLYDACVYVDNLLSGNDRDVNAKEKTELEDKIKKYSIDEELFSAKVNSFLTSLSDLQFKARYFSISNLIEDIYNTLNVKEIVSAMTDGRQRRANLDTLYDLAVKFENSSYAGLFNFNRYIEKINDVAIDQGQAKIYDENSDAVRIMTLHTSKGLEFNTVFLCGCNSDYNFIDSSEDTDSQFDQEYGVGLDYYDLNIGYKCNTAKKLLIAARKEKETKLEELRMLYVALTRAEKKLYITGAASRKGGQGFTYKLLGEFIESKNQNQNMKLDISECSNYMEVVLSNYPVLDEKYCSFEAHEWKIREEIEDTEEISIEEVLKDLRNEKSIINSNKEYFSSVEEKKLDNDLIDNYAYIDYQKLKPKYSVSALKKANYEIHKKDKQKVVITDDDRDDALDDKKNSYSIEIKGKELGNAYHRFMHFYDFKEKKYLCEKERDSSVGKIVNSEKIDIFLQSKIGQEMTKASAENNLFREQKFMKLYSQKEVNDYLVDIHKKKLDLKKELLDEKNIIIQGIIDAFYIKKDESGSDYIVIVDYKTDAMSRKTVDKAEIKKQLVDNYKLQLDIYADAVSELTGLEVKEKYLYSFAIDEVIEV